jgi:hypothetical protein
MALLPMIGSVIGGFAKVGTWLGAVQGADFVVEKAKEYTKGRETAEPIVAGIGDTFMTLLDPLDFAGVRKKKEQQQAEEKAGLQKSAAKQKKIAAKEKKAKEQALKAQKATAAKLKEAQAKAAEATARAQKLAAAGKTKDAALQRQRAQAAARYRQLSQRIDSEAEAKKAQGKPEEAANLSLAALEIAKLALNPPKSPIEAILKEGTPAGKSAITAIIDAVNREGDPDIEGLFQRLQSGDTQAYDAVISQAWDSASADVDFDSIEGAVAGSCCSACKISGGSCATKREPEDDVLVSGKFGDMSLGDFTRYFTFGEEDDGIVSGEDSFMEEYYGSGLNVGKPLSSCRTCFLDNSDAEE